MEQDFIEAEELELYKIMLEKKEILFNWVGYERALKMLQDYDSDDEIDAEEKAEIYQEHLTIFLRIMNEELNGALILSMAFSER